MGRFLILLVCAAPLAAAPVPKALTKPRPVMQGPWEVVERWNDGKPVKSSGPEFWVIGSDQYSTYDAISDGPKLWIPANKGTSGKLTFPDPQDPMAFDTTTAGSHRVGRFELDGDTLRVCLAFLGNNTRPVEVKPDAGMIYIKFQRVDESKLKAK